MRDPVTIGYTVRYWGHDFIVRKVDGHVISGMGWCERGPSVGDMLVLPNGDETTRYRVTEVRRMVEPQDMFAYTATFAPRTEDDH